MLDIPEYLGSLRKKEAQERIQLVQITNSKHMEKEDYKKFVQGLYKQAGFKTEVTNKFDRGKMDELHAFTAKFFGSKK